MFSVLNLSQHISKEERAAQHFLKTLQSLKHDVLVFHQFTDKKAQALRQPVSLITLFFHTIISHLIQFPPVLLSILPV